MNTKMLHMLSTFFLMLQAACSNTQIERAHLDMTSSANNINLSESTVWHDFIEHPNICNITLIQDTLKLTQIEVPDTPKHLEYFSAEFVKRLYYISPHNTNSRIATFNARLDSTKLCVSQNELQNTNGAGVYIPTIDKTYSEDEIKNPSKYPRQILFRNADKNISLDVFIGDSQCVEDLTIEQQHCQF